MLIAALALLVNVVNTTGEYLFGRYIVEQANAMFSGTDAAAQAARERFVGETYSQYYGAVNLIGFLLQMFVVGACLQVVRRRHGARHSSDRRNRRLSHAAPRAVAAAARRY